MTDSLQIYISSSNADDVINDGSYTFNLPLIEVSSQFHIYISIANASIPISFYNVNSSNNVLKYSVLGSIYTVTIPIGNYNVNTMKTYLNSVMTNFTITYSYALNKFTFVHSSNEFGLIALNSTSFKLLGITSSGQNSSSLSLTSGNCVDMSPIKALCIETNLQTGNFNKLYPQSNNTLCCLPIDVQPTGILTYVNTTLFKSNLFTNVLNSIAIRLCDQNGTTINFNGCDWAITLQIDVNDYVEG